MDFSTLVADFTLPSRVEIPGAFLIRPTRSALASSSTSPKEEEPTPALVEMPLPEPGTIQSRLISTLFCVCAALIVTSPPAVMSPSTSAVVVLFSTFTASASAALPSGPVGARTCMRVRCSVAAWMLTLLPDVSVAVSVTATSDFEMVTATPIAIAMGEGS